MMERMLQSEATRRLKVEASEVHGRLALSNSFACRVEVALSRVARNERGKELTRRRTRSSSMLGSTTASGTSQATRRDAQHHHVPYVEQQRQAQRRHVLEESDELRQLRLRNLQNAALCKKETKLVDEGLLHAKCAVEARHDAVQAFASSLKRQLASRLHAMANAAGDTGFFSPQAHRKLLAPLRHAVGDASVSYGRTPSPTRSHRNGAVVPAASAAASLGSRNKGEAVNASTPPLLDAEAIADATCKWIAHVAENEDDAKRLADQALVDIRREVNLEACRQRKVAEAKQRSQSEQVVQRNEMARTVALAQQRATSSVRALAAQARTVSRVSEAQLRTARLPTCMRHAASVFSLQELETVMSKHLQSSMEAHQLRRRTDLSHTAEYFKTALVVAEEGSTHTKADAATILKEVCAMLGLTNAQQHSTSGNVSSHSIVNACVPHRFLFGGGNTSIGSPLRTVSKHHSSMHSNAQRQLLLASLNQLHARCEPHDAAFGGAPHPSSRHPSMDNNGAGQPQQPSSAIVEALVSHVHAIPKGGDGSSASFRNSPLSSSNRLVASSSALTPPVNSIGNGIRKPSDVLDLTACRGLTVADVALVKECVMQVDPKVTALRVAASAVAGDAAVAAALLELCLENPQIHSVEVVHADSEDGGQRSANAANGTDAPPPPFDALTERIHTIMQAVVRKQREVALHRRGLHMAKHKLSHARARESEEAMQLGMLRRRLVHSVRMMVELFELGERLARSHIAFVQDAVYVALHNEAQRGLRCVQALHAKRDVDARAQKIVLDEEAAERVAMECLAERNAMLLTKELLTAKQTFRRMSRRLSMGLALTKRSSVASASGNAGQAGAASDQATHTKHPQSPLFPSQKTSRAVSPVEDDDDDATPDAERRAYAASAAAVASAEGHFGPIAISMRISPRSSREASQSAGDAPESDAPTNAVEGEGNATTRPPPPPDASPSTTSPVSSSFVELSHKLETRASELAHDDIRPIHSSSATTRPKQVVFQSPPPSRQRVD